MNSPFDAHLNYEGISAEERESSSRPFENFSPPPTAANQPADETVRLAKQLAEDFLVPELKATWAPAERKAPEKIAPEPPIRMLVVDDLPVNRKLIATQLRKLGYEVDQAENGSAAVAKVKSEEYALVFMDLEMPVMNGYQAAIEIRQYDLDNRQHTPIVGMSSYSRQVEKERCVTSGMDDLVSKGISGMQLRELLSLMLSRKKAPSGARESASGRAGDIDIQLLLDENGRIDEYIIDLSLGAMKTFVGCLRCALEDRDLSSARRFAEKMKVPCDKLGLKSMARLSLRIFADATMGEWQEAEAGIELLQSQYNQILDQVDGLTAELHKAVFSEE